MRYLLHRTILLILHDTTLRILYSRKYNGGLHLAESAEFNSKPIHVSLYHQLYCVLSMCTFVFSIIVPKKAKQARQKHFISAVAKGTAGDCSSSHWALTEMYLTI